MKRKIGLAVLLTLTAANRLRAQSRPSEFYFVPVVAHTEGALSSFFQSDLSIVNPQSASIIVTAYVLPGGADNTGYLATGKSFTLAAHSSLFLADVLKAQWGQQGLATLVLAATGGASAARRFIANSRTYNNANPLGTFGLAVAPTFVETPTGSQAVLAGLSNNANYRANIGVFNDSAAPATVAIDVYDQTGTLLGSTPIGLAPYSLAQKAVKDFVPNFDSGYAVVRPSGAPGMSLVAYAAVADNGTSDSTYFEAVPLVSTQSTGSLQRELAGAGLLRTDGEEGRSRE